MSRRTDRVSRLIAASPERLHEAFVNADQQRIWLPPPGMKATFERFEPRVGGRYRMTLRYDEPQKGQGKSGDGEDVVEGQFQALEPARRIVQTAEFDSDDPAFAGTMTMTWLFRPRGNQTEVEIVASNVPPGISAADHQKGLSGSLANLARFVEEAD